MRIEHASAHDCRAIAEVHVEAWQHAYRDMLPAQYLSSLSIWERQTMWQGLVQHSPERLFVAKSDEQVLGFVAFGACRDPGAAADCAEIWAVYVKPSAWSSGIGCALWLSAWQQLRDEDYRRVSLWVIEHNLRAIRFYRKAGFVLDTATAKQSLDINGTVLAEVRYVRAIDDEDSVAGA
jgi:ribosomal protein S18 acetylase RimI-like enzyme